MLENIPRAGLGVLDRAGAKLKYDTYLRRL